MEKIETILTIKGDVKEIKEGKNEKGRWSLIKLKNGKGYEDIFINDDSVNKLRVRQGDTIIIKAELWKDKKNNYNWMIAKASVIDVVPFK